jgi:antitoxin YefM
MKTVPISRARANIFYLVDEAAENHEPVLILGKRNNAVLVPEQDWNSLQETVHILSVPGMREAILEAAATPLDEYFDEEQLPW